MKICACNSPLRDDDPTKHTEAERDTHKGEVAFEVDFEQGPPPDPKERQVNETAARLVDEALPTPPLTEADVRTLSPEDRELL